jgi:nucleoside-triphosphatase THEP1
MVSKQRFIVTGEQGSGKTTFCQALIRQAQKVGWQIAGVLSPPVFKGDEKVGIDIVDLSTSQRKGLANLREEGGDGPQTIRWAFNGDVLAWGNDVLGNVPSCDLLIVDELGPLEFEREEGWLNGFCAVDTGEYKFAVIVVRPQLVEGALEKWPDARVIEISHQDRASELVEEFFLNNLGG